MNGMKDLIQIVKKLNFNTKNTLKLVSKNLMKY